MPSNRLGKFLSLRTNDRLLLLEACCGLGLARICLFALPFRWIARGMLERTTEPLRHDLTPEQLAGARRIRWAIRSAARHVPWRAVCLPQSLAAKLMLRRREIPATLYFGVRTCVDASRRMEAHAWVRAGDTEVTPSQGAGAFAVVAMFS
jgi:Transglutaminase-like superfamily